MNQGEFFRLYEFIETVTKKMTLAQQFGDKKKSTILT